MLSRTLVRTAFSTCILTLGSLASRAAAEEPISDDFNQPSTNQELWSLIDPVGDASSNTEGFASGEAQLSLSLPAGSNHDLWNDENEAPRLLQPIGDVDMQLVARFTSPLANQYQMQGIVIQDTFDILLRFELYSANDGIHVFAASIEPRSPSTRIDIVLDEQPEALRVTRQGSVWSLDYAYSDGEGGLSAFVPAGSFEYNLVAHEAGIHAGNYARNESEAPAHTMLCDFFMDMSAPIIDEDGFTVDFENSLIEAQDPNIFQGESTLINVLPLDLDGEPIGPGLDITLSTSLGTLIGNLIDEGNGTYTQELRMETKGTAEISASMFDRPLGDAAMVVAVDPATSVESSDSVRPVASSASPRFNKRSTKPKTLASITSSSPLALMTKSSR